MIAEDAEEFGSGEDDDDLGAEESEFEEMEFGDVVDEAEDEGDFGICDEIKNDDVYKVLGQDSFNDLKKIKVTPSWILNGTIFPAELCDENYANLEMVSGMHPLLSERVRQEIGKWFPVQNAVLPRLIDEAIHISVLPPRDIVVSSPTGSGKTLCYILPIINSLSKSQHSNSLTAVIVAPVQSLVQQIEKEFQRFNVFNITTAVLCGSQAYDDEQPLVNAAQVFFATPGRLIDHILDTRSAIDFSHVRYLVIDEADQMTDLARLEWLATLETLCNYSCSSTAVDDLMNGGSRLQKILVSATLSQDVDKLHQWQLRFPKLYRANSSSPIDVVQISSLDETDFIVGATATPATIKHKVVVCNPKLKPLAVYEEIEKRSDWKKILVFTNKKISSFRLTMLLKFLNKEKYRIEEFSSNLYGHRRQKVLRRFMRGDTRLLISSDALSRGIDVHDIDAVINYDKPHDERNFIHRIGRTGRRGKQGDALTFIAHDEQTSLNDMVMRVGHKPDATVEFTVDNASDLVKKYQQALLELKDFVGPDKNKVKTFGRYNKKMNMK